MDQLLSSFLLLKLGEAPRSFSDGSIPPQASIQAPVAPSAAASTQALTPDPSQAPTSDQCHAQDPARNPRCVAESHLDQEGGIPDSMLNTIRRQTETVADEHPRANRSRPLPTPNRSPQMDKSQVSEPAPFPAFPEEDEEALPLPKRTGTRLYPCINCPCTCPVNVPITFKDRKSDSSHRMAEEGVDRVMQKTILLQQ
jgi:hypothetical protein